MNRKKLIIRVISLVFLLFFFNYVAMTLHWYSSIWYFDMPMHFWGGFWLALTTFLFLNIKNLDKNMLFKLFLIILVISIGWEIFEIIVNNYTIKDNFNILDTLSDLCFDMAGASFASTYFLKRIMFQKENTL